MTDNPFALDEYGDSPIHKAAQTGYTEIVKILTPLTDNPNAPDYMGRTPIYCAALKNHIEIVKLLAPLTDNPNAPDYYGNTPSSLTKNAEILRILGSFKKPTALSAKEQVAKKA